MARHFLKTVNENPPFAIDWGDVLSNENNGLGDTIDTSTWTITPSGLTTVTDSVDSDNTRALIQVSGGTAGITYKLVNAIVLVTGNYTLEDYITIRVTE